MLNVDTSATLFFCPLRLQPNPRGCCFHYDLIKVAIKFYNFLDQICMAEDHEKWTCYRMGCLYRHLDDIQPQQMPPTTFQHIIVKSFGPYIPSFMHVFLNYFAVVNN